MALKVTGGQGAAKAGLDLNRYDEAQLQKLNYVTDGEIDAVEANAALRVADVNADGFVSKSELRAFDYLLGKDSSVAGARAFHELYADRGALSEKVDSEWAGAYQKMQAAEQEHDQQVGERSSSLDELRQQLQADGIEVPIQSEQQLNEELRKLPPGDPKRAALERQIQYAGVKEQFDDIVDGTGRAKDQARAAYRGVTDGTKTVKQLLAEASSRAPAADAVVVAEKAATLSTGMRAVRELVRTSPEVQRDVKGLAKAQMIKNAVADGTLDADAVDMKKVDAAIAKYQGRLEVHTARLENTAKTIVKYMESPEFKQAMESLPADERAEIEGALNRTVADTKAGQAYFDRNILPALEGDAGADPYFKRMLDGTSKVVPVALEVLAAHGAHLIAEKGPDAMRVVDESIARVIGIDKAMMPKIYDAMEVANGQGLAAAEAKLAADPDLAKVAGNFHVIAGGVAALSLGLSAFEMMGDPSLRNGLATAQDATELAGVLASATSSTAAIARYARFAGKVAPALDVVVGALDAKAAWDRDDTAGAVGGGMRSVGGGMVLAAAATGVGVPLAVAGALVTAAGELVGWLWGDSASEKWMKANAKEYLASGGGMLEVARKLQ